MGAKLTTVQADLLMELVVSGCDLVNGDEAEPRWWIDKGGTAKAQTAEAIVKRGFVRFYRHEGGQPGVDFYCPTKVGIDALTDAGRLALKESTK